MRIAVTGASGFLGSRVCKTFERQGHTVAGIGRPDTDITDLAAVRQALDAFRPDGVIHCAAIADIGTCERDPDLANKVNIVGTENIASVCADRDVRLVFVSSDQVYDYKSMRLLDEYTPVRPLNHYGFTKVEGEKAVSAVVKKHFIARIAWQYGFDEPGLRNGRGGLLQFAEQALMAPDGKLWYRPGSYRCVSYVYDTANVLAAMTAGNLPYGTYNVASPNDLCEYDMCAAMLTSLGADERAVERILTENPDGDCVDLRAYPRHLLAVGYAMPSYPDGLARCMRERAACTGV